MLFRSFTNVHPRAIVQIVHDISEHSLRYREFASALNDAGFYVCGNDLIGHGMSKQGHPGCFGLRKNSYEGLLGDIDSLFREVSNEVGEDVPRIIIGAGFGAMLSELYTIRYGNIAMIVSMENLEIPGGISFIKMNANNHIMRKGYNSISESVHNMMYQTAKLGGGDVYSDFYWVSKVREEIDKYIQDDNRQHSGLQDPDGATEPGQLLQLFFICDIIIVLHSTLLGGALWHIF